MISVSRFQVWIVSLNPTKGREINKTRPCVVISPNEMAALSTALVAPMTTKGFDFPCRIKCSFKGKNGLILLPLQQNLWVALLPKILILLFLLIYYTDSVVMFLVSTLL